MSIDAERTAIVSVLSEAGPGYPACQIEGGIVMPGLAEVLTCFGLERHWGVLQRREPALIR